MEFSLSTRKYIRHSLSRRRVQTTDPNVTKFVKNVRIMEFHDHIWNHNEKRIKISTNMPGIGSLIRKIAITISEM